MKRRISFSNVGNARPVTVDYWTRTGQTLFPVGLNFKNTLAFVRERNRIFRRDNNLLNKAYKEYESKKLTQENIS